jgi:ATP-dependent Clp protease, protease subunit
MKMADEVYVSFASNVTLPAMNQLLGIFGKFVQEKAKRAHLLISSNGGNIHCGITIYNVLRGLPLELYTYNVGNVDSIATVIYLAGIKRFASPRSSFLFHSVGLTFAAQQTVPLINMEEHVDSLRKDQKLIGDVVADRTSIDANEITKMFGRAACIAPDDAVAKGIAHDVTEVKVPDGAPFYQLVFS